MVRSSFSNVRLRRVFGLFDIISYIFLILFLSLSEYRASSTHLVASGDHAGLNDKSAISSSSGGLLSEHSSSFSKINCAIR
jgi:hypothetical protein